jgi:PAS domain S-box-containing protein
MQEYNNLTLIQKMDIIVCKKQIDEPWSLLSIEGGAELLFGYARKLFVAKSKKGFATWIHADDIANIKMQLQEALANKTPISFVYRLLHKDGKYITIHEQGTIIWEGDKPLYSESILSVLPEYIPTLPQKEDNKYKALLDASSEGLLIHRNYITLEVNKAFCDMFGYRADEIIGKEIMSQIMARGNDPDIERLLSQLKEMPDFAYQNIMWFKRKDGQKVFVSVKGSNLIIDEEELRCVLFRDISQEVETRQALMAANEKYRSLLSGSREGVVIHDNGIAIEASPRFAEIVGKSTDKIFGN